MKPLDQKKQNRETPTQSLPVTPDTPQKTSATALASAATPAAPQTDAYLTCPSFDDEPWKSRAAALRPLWLRPETIVLDGATAHPPLPATHPYVKLVTEFLDTVPDECWLDEENEQD